MFDDNLPHFPAPRYPSFLYTHILARPRSLIPCGLPTDKSLGIGIEQSFGLAIVTFTLTVKAFLVPLQVIQLESTEKMQSLAPTVKEINDKFGANKEAATAATNRLYSSTKVNPLIGCLPALLQVQVAKHLEVCRCVHMVVLCSSHTSDAVEDIALSRLDPRLFTFLSAFSELAPCIPDLSYRTRRGTGLQVTTTAGESCIIFE